MSRVVLRARRGVEDANAVARLIIELGAYYSRLAPDHFAAVDDDGLAAWLAADGEWLDDPANLGLVAELDGEIVGYLEASLQEPSPNARFDANRDMRERRLFIGLVVVAEAQKRHRIATQLVQAAESWAQDQGVYLAICDTYLGSPQSLPFWKERMGYQRRAVRLRKRLSDQSVTRTDMASRLIAATSEKIFAALIDADALTS
jgi:GNAT superfamily N-acetyltransferase